MTTLSEPVQCEVLVIGGGPAGMAAALAASEAGAKVTLVDERSSLGGQIYKQSSSAFEARDEARQGAQYRRGREMIAAMMRGGVEVLTETTAWAIWGREAFLCRNDCEVRRIRATSIIIASGAYDRPVPFPGWTLPGVMTAGGAQSVVKVFRVAPGRRILMAGSGPLSLSFAAELKHHGANVIMLTEACRRPTPASIHRLFRAGLGNLSTLVEGFKYLSSLRFQRVPVRWSTMVCRAEGETRVERAVITRVDEDWRPVPGSEEVLDVDTICLGYGLSPSNEMTRLCGCAHDYDEQRGGWVARRDEWMRSSVPGILVAGDCAGISGVATAIQEGRVAGLAAAVDTGHLRVERATTLAQSARAELRRQRGFRGALDSIYRVGAAVYDLADDRTVICRCEEVTLGEIRGALRRFPADTQGVKTCTRAGMGLCQGRMCGLQVAAEVAKVSRVPIGSVAPYSVRPPVKPLPIAAVAAEMPERGRPIVELDPRMEAGGTLAPRARPAEADVAIVGGGLLGCALAFKLAKVGVDAVLLERGDLNREASGTNGGSLHIQLLRPPALDEAWLEKFRPLVRLHADSATAWRRLEAEAGISVGVRMHGGLLIADTLDQMRILRQKVAIERAEGLETTLISGTEARAMCPLLSESVIAADYCADDGVANSLLVAPALADRAAQYGGRIAPHHEVLAINVLGVRDFLLHTTRSQVHARRVVVAAGGWTARVAKMVGVSLPIGPDILSMNVTEAQRPELDLLIQHAGRRLTLKQTDSGTYIIGGGWPGEYVQSENRKVPSLEGVAGNMWAAASIVPRIARLRIIRTWAGLGANTPDWAPIVGECPQVPGFHVLFAGLGFTLGLTCAQLMAELLTQPNGPGSAALTAFAPSRHAGYHGKTS